MSEQALLEQAKICLEQGEYETAIALLESCIEENPEELTYYWYLGLVYLLQENEELAQEIWFSVFLQGSLEAVEQWTAKLISFLETKIQENITAKKLGNAKIIYEAIFIIDPDYENPELLNNLVEALSLFASVLSFNKEYEEAISVYKTTLEIDPNHSISRHSLALCYYHTKDFQNAKINIDYAINLDPNSAENYHLLGLILEKLDDLDNALYAYQIATQKDTSFFESFNRLGKLYLKKENPQKAIESYSKALEIAQNKYRPPIFASIGEAYKVLGDDVLSSLYFGYAGYFGDTYETAIAHFESFLEKGVPDIQAYRTISHCYFLLDQTNNAIDLAEKGLQVYPNNLLLKRLNQVILPILYQDEEEISFYRQRFSGLLEDLINETKLETVEQQEEAFNSLQNFTNFYFNYQGQDDLLIQKQYANYTYQIMSKLYPHWCQSRTFSSDIKNRKIRLGFISTRLQGLGILYLGWLKYINKNIFEIYTYDISGYDENAHFDNLKFREQFKIYSDHMEFVTDTGINKMCQSVDKDKLDILVFPEILDTKIIALSCLRLAPIQCTTWSHPITSGNPNIDYFLSSDLMEPDDADEHYSEKLIRLPNIGFAISPPISPEKTKSRADFQLNKEDIVYLCCQSLFKYLPQHDYIFPSIAKENKLFKFVFIDCYLGPKITETFKRRIAKAFKKLDLDYEHYCIFLPRVSQQDHTRLQQLSDVFLDGLTWSGGVTTREAIFCSLPVVTCPGRFMRARHSYAMLKMIGVEDTIASNEIEYIEIATRLGIDSAWRQVIKNKIDTNKERLFEDQECVRGLEAFLQEAISSFIANHSTPNS